MTIALKNRSRTRATRIASAAAKAGNRVPGNPVASLRRALAIPRSKFARLLGRTERAIIDWESAKAQPQGLSQQRIRELERLTAALRGLFDTRELGKWFDTPNPAFGGLKPIEVIERGESDRLWHMIFEIKAGTHV